MQSAYVESFWRGEFHTCSMCFNTHVLKESFWGATLEGRGLPVRNYQRVRTKTYCKLREEKKIISRLYFSAEL